MWQCPMCNREFKNVSQNHYCQKPENTDDYINAQRVEIQPILQELRAIIKAALPLDREIIKWGMPYFIVVGENFTGFAAQKNHISFFPGAPAIKEFEARLTEYNLSSKGNTVHLPYDQPLDKELITDMLRWRLDNL